ncbi:MAG: PHP domain-containing protein [Desulfatibacillaceae bacterium]
MESDRPCIDLHVHTTASDGTDSPAGILDLAHGLGLSAVAITDHDTVEGAREALRERPRDGLAFVPGVEISVSVPDPYADAKGTLHILGYFIDVNHHTLTRSLNILQEARANRNPQIIERLHRMGLDLSYEEVLDSAGGGQLGRPHIAQMMVAKGVVPDIQAAFSNYLGKGRPAYVEKYRLGVEEALSVILEAGGLPVLAHPFSLKMEGDRLDSFVSGLADLGLRGIEVYYPEHSEKQVAAYLALVEKYGLLATGGTDFHGSRKPNISLGKGKGNLHIPYDLYEELLAEHRRHVHKRSA